MDRFRSLPIARPSVLLGHTLGDLAVGLIGLAVVTGIGVLFGWRPERGPLPVLAGFLLLAVFMYAMLWVGVLLGLFSRNMETINVVAGLVTVLLSFLSNAFQSVDRLPAWLRPVADWNPVSAVVTWTRELWGNPTATGGASRASTPPRRRHLPGRRLRPHRAVQPPPFPHGGILRPGPRRPRAAAPRPLAPPLLAAPPSRRAPRSHRPSPPCSEGSTRHETHRIAARRTRETEIPDPDSVDLTDLRAFTRPDLRAIWARFRAERPVHHHRATPGAPPFWVLSRHADVVAVYRDDKRFTSERGSVLATLLQGEDSASGKMLAVTDGPRHREIRNLMLKSFSPRVLAPVVEGVNVRTAALLDEALERGAFDFVVDLADHIPINTIGDLMGVPVADREQLVHWNTMTLSRTSEEHGAEEEWLARNEILLYFSGLAAQRRRHPGEDVISALATGTVDGRLLTEDEIVFNRYSLILGGDESSRMSSVGAVIALAEHP